MTDQLPAVLPSGAIAPAAAADTYIVPVLVAASGADAIDRFLNFFATQIENDNTRAAYLRAAREFLAWCDGQKIGLLADIQPVHVAAWIKQSKLSHSIPTAKLRLAAIRHLFDGMVTGHVIQTNPALSVRGAMWCARAKRRSSMRLRCACCSIASAARRTSICATRR
jgi:Phage integrase, N-terminal SAM-like domain